MTPEQALMQGFTSELQKLAATPRAVKQYRRAMAGLETALRDVQSSGHSSARKGFALHGTEDLAGVVEDGKLYASEFGETGQHGPGVYWWRGFPREQYLRGPTREGVLTDLEALPGKKPMMRNIKGGHINDQATRSLPDYQLQPRDTVVIDTASRAGTKELDQVMADVQDQRLRTMDSGVWSRALKDFKTQNMRAQGQSPPDEVASPSELVSLLRRRSKGELG